MSGLNFTEFGMAVGEAAAEGEAGFTSDEAGFMVVLMILADVETQETDLFPADEVKRTYEGVRELFSRLPVENRIRREVVKTVIGQLGAEGEKMRKAGKKDEQIFEEWLKRVFIPLYRRAGKK